MKKIILSLISVFVIAMIIGCGQTVETSKSTPAAQTQDATVSTSSESTSAVSSATEASESKVEQQASDSTNKDVLGSVVEYFKSNGFTIGAKSEKMAAMIGAKAGFAIELNGNKVEFYEYDLDSKEQLTVTSLKTAKDGYIDMSGFKINVILNSNLIMAAYDNNPDKDKLIELFKNYK